ncbi:MAG: cytochrome c biogenesis protein CcsA [Calditrichia bacterium]
MLTGILTIAIAFVGSTVAAAAYWLYYKNEDERYFQLANRSFAVMGIGVFFAGILLYFNIFAHNFQLNYVYSYTSSSLSTYYLISTFWAGQEGTFLLWLMLGTVYGIFLIRTVGKREPLVLFFVLLVQSFLLLILLKKSPFAYIWQAHSEAPVGFTPADGRGLNPLLENPWMIIHPPIMFVGYSSTVVAFAFALNAMIKRQFREWIFQARPWVIFANLALGAGIILGGYWSYVTLGWGGYWAWDPVENASLVPWLFAAVLLHGLIIQARQKGLVRTNLLLAGGAFIAVLWGSFLTRSGVLADFSVHSFGASDLNLYLIAFFLFFTGLFLAVFFKTSLKVESPKFAEGLFSRETFILIGMLSLLFTGIVVFVATSSPIYTGLFGQPSNVGIDFYNTISIPVAIFILVSMALAPLLAWRISELREPKTIMLAAGLSAIITIAGVFLGLSDWVSIALVFLSAFTILTNAYVLFRILPKHRVKMGAYLSHVGLALMIIGIITSSRYDVSEKVTLPQGEYVPTPFGYEIKFNDFVRDPAGKDWIQLKVRKGSKEFEAKPRFYFSSYTNSYMANPHVAMGMERDLYISPISFIPAKRNDVNLLTLQKGESKSLGELKIQFKKFEVGDHQDGATMTVKALLEAKVTEQGYEKSYEVVPAMWMADGELQSSEVRIPGTEYKVKVDKLDANTGSVTLAVMNPSKSATVAKDQVAIEVSVKPLISILWLGTLILLAGMAVSIMDKKKRTAVEI